MFDIEPVEHKIKVAGTDVLRNVSNFQTTDRKSLFIETQRVGPFGNFCEWLQRAVNIFYTSRPFTSRDLYYYSYRSVNCMGNCSDIDNIRMLIVKERSFFAEFSP